MDCVAAAAVDWLATQVPTPRELQAAAKLLRWASDEAEKLQQLDAVVHPRTSTTPEQIARFEDPRDGEAV